MSQRSINEKLNPEYEHDIDSTYKNVMNKYNKNDKTDKDWYKSKDTHQSSHQPYYVNSDILQNQHSYDKIESIYAIPDKISKNNEPGRKLNSPICISKGELGGPTTCICNRHFQLKVPDLRSNELSTSL